MISKKSRLFGAVMLISGTTIGAAMLALPITTGLAGFFPSFIIMTGIWLFMLLTAYYLLEVNLRMKGESNIISMASKTLGAGGQIVAWIIYLLLLYSVMSAYLVGCSEIVGELFSPLFKWPIWGWPLVLFGVFSVFLFLGTVVIDFSNRVLMAGVFLSFLLLTGTGIFRIHGSLLTHVEWNRLLPSLSVVLVTFGYHIIIPTLTTYLEHDTKALKQAIWIGSLIPFILYIIWQFFVMGLVPPAELAATASRGDQIAFTIRDLLDNIWVTTGARFFSLFSILTSLLGVSLSLSDFLADGLKIEKKSWNKLWVIALTFIPPLLFAVFFPHGFVIALKYAGICIVILLALLPAWMAYFERYGPETERTLLPSHFKVFGGKWLIVATIVVSLILLAIEVVK